MNVSWQNRKKLIEDAIQKHELASTQLFSSLDSITDLSPLNAVEQEARSRIVQAAAELAEACNPEDHNELVTVFERLQSHFENWEISTETIRSILERARGSFTFQINSII